MKRIELVILRFLAVCFLLVATEMQGATTTEWLNRKVEFKQTEETVYQLLRQITDQTGYLFIYDSQVIQNNRKVKLSRQVFTLQEAIYIIIGNKELRIELVGNHILLSLPERQAASSPDVPSSSSRPGFISVNGQVFDLFSKEPVTPATISIHGSSVGVVTNQDGRFRIRIPDSLQYASLLVSHIGYESSLIEIDLATDKPIKVALEPRVVPLQEVVIRPVNPILVIRKALQNKKQNYSDQQPRYLLSFYREVVERKNKNQSLTEAILKTYKNDYRHEGREQIKLIKMRHIVDQTEKDTIFAKIKSGLYSTMLLDIMKVHPEFLLPDEASCPFEYTHTDITTLNGRPVNVISFEQSPNNKEPLYRGLLYIDQENYALVEARFELHPDYVKKATNLFVEKKSRKLDLSLRKAAYTVSYKPDNDGVYYLYYIRGEVDFRVRKKVALFNTSLKLWFEMVTCDVDKENVTPFPRVERLTTRSIFSETNHKYDADFWKNFNVILPEEELKELIINNLSKVTKRAAPEIYPQDSSLKSIKTD